VAWTPYALAIKGCGGRVEGQPTVAAIRGFMRTLFAVLYPLAFLGTGLLGALVATGRTAFPRWLAAFSLPLSLALLKVLTPAIPAPLGGLVAGAQLSLSAAVFFLAVLLASGAEGGAPSPATN
jgi:hypothetical protein